MSIATTTPLTGGWWLARLAGQLAARRPHYDEMARYYNTEQGIPAPATKAVRQAYQRLMRMARMNWAELVVEAVRERQDPIAFRTGADSDEGGDAEAWRIWQANSLDADSSLLFRTVLELGAAYTIVGDVDPETDQPTITIEDPRQVITEADPIRRRKAQAGLKLFYDDMLGRWHAYVYLPGIVAQAAGPRTSEKTWDEGTTFRDWEWMGPPAELPARLRQTVPVVAFLNQADLDGNHWAEFERHTPILDRIAYQVLQRLEIATLQAFKQRMIRGVPILGPNGQPIDYNDIFAADPGALWVAPETAQMWESGAVDLTPIRMAVRDDVTDLAAATRTPLFYLTPEATNGSAEGASLAREGLVFKTGDRNKQAGESLEQTMALAFLVKGDLVRAARSDMEVVWADPQRFSMSERYDAASKAVTAGVPWRQRMSKILQFSPQEIERMEVDRTRDAMLAAMAAPLAQPPVAPGGPADAVPVAQPEPMMVAGQPTPNG